MLGLRNVLGSPGTFTGKLPGGNLYFTAPNPCPMKFYKLLGSLGHTLKLSPHEQLALAFGLENLNPPATIALE